MKNIIIAMNNNYLINKINNYKGISYKNLQYREAILEILEKNKNIDLIFIDEKIPGEINIEKLIEKIKLINNKINIIFFLDKENNQKINKLKKLGVENIYINNKINIEKVINNLLKKENKNNNIKNNKLNNEINNKLERIIKNKLNKKESDKLKNKIITIEGKPKSGKTTITMLIINYLIIKNKKILLINLNKKTEKHYYKILKLNKKSNLEKNNYNLENKKQINNKSKCEEIRVNKNLIFINEFQKIIENKTTEKLNKFFNKYTKEYDYIIFDIGDRSNNNYKKQIIKNGDKNLVVINSDILDNKELKKIKKNKKYIIYNKYKILSISNLNFLNIIGRNFYSKIPFNNNYKKLSKQFYKNKKIFIDNKIKKQLEKILK